MEFDDITKLFKFWRTFKSLKNWQSGGIRGKLKAVMMVFAIGFSGVSYLLYGEITSEELQLTAQDQPVLTACLNNHKSLNMSFQGRISNRAGCGCTAKMVTASIETQHLDLWARAHALMLHNYQESWSVSTDAQQKVFEQNKARMYSALQQKSNMPRQQYSDMIVNLERIDDICEDEQTYETENITQIASLRPIGFVASEDVQEDVQFAKGDVVEIQLRGASGPIKTASK